MGLAVFGEALAEFGVYFGSGWLDRGWRRRQGDGFDLPDGDRPPALLMGGGVENVPLGNAELRFRRRGWWRRAVRDIAEDAGSGRSHQSICRLAGNRAEVVLRMSQRGRGDQDWENS